MIRTLSAFALAAVVAAGVALAPGNAAEDKAEAPAPPAEAPAPPADAPQSALDFKMKSLAGEDVDLAKYKGKVVLMVNVASKCGYTPQYKGLEELHEKYAGDGLAILGFPANNFGQQEPGTNQEIGEFCQKNYGVKFDMFSKISVKGDDQAPLYQYLTTHATDSGDVKWNFEKFLIGRDGQIVARFRSKVTPTSEEMVKAIETELAKK